MKKLLTLILILATTSVINTTAQTLKFKLTGTITGAEKGDTLRFEEINTRWEVSPGFDVIIGTNGKIKYKGKHQHTQQYTATYLPINGDKTNNNSRGLAVLIKDGTTNIVGTKEYIYHATKLGGMYDDELQKILAIDDSLSMIRSNYAIMLAKFRPLKDTTNIKLYEDKFNNFYGTKSIQENYARADKMMKAYATNSQSEYVVLKIAENSHAQLIEQKESYAKLSPELKNSYYGQVIKSSIDELEPLESGQPAPDFKLTTTKGETITLDTFNGKYLLIYHFGLCPGSMQIDKYVSNFHNKFKDVSNVLSYTSNMTHIKEFQKISKDGYEMMGMKVKPILEGMLSHPWEHEVDTQLNIEDMSLSDSYKFKGLPYFIFISPDGKMIGRGYSEVFSLAVKTLESL